MYYCGNNNNYLQWKRTAIYSDIPPRNNDIFEPLINVLIQIPSTVNYSFSSLSLPPSGMKQETLDKISIFLAELLGTALLVFIGCMGCIGSLGVAVTHLNICLIFGLAVMMCVQIFGCVSGCHINPAVTIAAIIYEHIPPMVSSFNL